MSLSAHISSLEVLKSNYLKTICLTMCKTRNPSWRKEQMTGPKISITSIFPKVRQLLMEWTTNQIHSDPKLQRGFASGVSKRPLNNYR